MYQTITKTMFHDAFRDYNRLDNFSYEAREALYDYITEYEESCDEKVELDIIALCCEFYEDKIKDTLNNYKLESLEDLENETQVIWYDDEKVLYLAY